MTVTAFTERNPRMKKYSMKTRQGRVRRMGNPAQFNPYTLQPHTKKHLEEQRKAGFRRDRKFRIIR